MRALIMAAALLLSSCWEGPPFYSAADIVRVLEPGRYEARGADSTELISVVASDGGMTITREGQREFSYGLVPVDAQAGRFVAWAERSEEEVEHGAAVSYALLQRLGPNEYLLYYPTCTGRDADIAAAAGAEALRDLALPTCRFRTRAELEGALRQLVPRPERSVRVIRVPDGPR